MAAPEDDLCDQLHRANCSFGGVPPVNPGIAIVHAGPQIYAARIISRSTSAMCCGPSTVNGRQQGWREAYHLLFAMSTASRTRSLRTANVYGPGMRIKDALQTFLRHSGCAESSRPTLRGLGRRALVASALRRDRGRPPSSTPRSRRRPRGGAQGRRGESVSLAEAGRRDDRGNGGGLMRSANFRAERKRIDVRPIS